VTKEFLVLDTLGGCPHAPKSKAGGFKRFSHMGNHFALGQSGYLSYFLKSNPVGPGGPNNPVGTVFGRFRFFNPDNGMVGLFGNH